MVVVASIRTNMSADWLAVDGRESYIRWAGGRVFGSTDLNLQFLLTEQAQFDHEDRKGSPVGTDVLSPAAFLWDV